MTCLVLVVRVLLWLRILWILVGSGGWWLCTRASSFPAERFVFTLDVPDVTWKPWCKPGQMCPWLQDLLHTWHTPSEMVMLAQNLRSHIWKIWRFLPLLSIHTLIILLSTHPSLVSLFFVAFIYCQAKPEVWKRLLKLELGGKRREVYSLPQTWGWRELFALN